MYYTITAKNYGPSDASSVVITDIFDTGIFSSPEYYNTVTSTWVPWVGSLNIGTLTDQQDYELSVRAMINEGVSNPISNTVEISSSSNEIDSDNNTFTLITPLNANADISVSKQGPASNIAGETIEYQINVTNNSLTTQATNVKIFDNLSDLVINQMYSTDDGITWSDWDGILNIGSIDPASTKTILIKGDVLSSATGIISNSAYAESDIPDLNHNNNSASTETTITNQSNIEIEKRILTNANDIIAGSMIEYEIIYRNIGPSDAHNVIITDELSSDITNVESSRCRSAYLPWNTSFNAGTVVSGGECSIVLRGVIKSNFTGSIINTAFLTSDSIDPDSENNSATVVAPVNNISDLSIIKTSSSTIVKPGDSVVYKISVDNFSFSDAKNIVVNELLPSTLEIISVTTTHGVWNDPNWTIDVLVSGETAILTINAKVRDSAYGQVITNSVVVVNDNTDPDSGNNTSSVTINTTIPKTGQNNIIGIILIILSALGIISTLLLKFRPWRSI